MAYPIKYIEDNLVFNHDGECFAYYELIPYNYSFLSPDEKYQVHDNFVNWLPKIEMAKFMRYSLLQNPVFEPHKSDQKKKLQGAWKKWLTTK